MFSISDEELRRVDLELGRRAAVAGITQPMIYLAYRYLVDFPLGIPRFLDAIGFVLYVMSFIRVSSYLIQRKDIPKFRTSVPWRDIFRSSAYGLAFCWGAIGVSSLLLYGGSFPFFLAVLIIFGTFSLSLHSYGHDLVMTRLSTLLIVVPIILTLFAQRGPNYLALAFILIFGLLYLQFLAGNAHKLFWEVLQSREMVHVQRDQLTAVLDAIPGFVFWTDGAGRYLGANRRLTELYGVTSQDFVGQNLGSLITDREMIKLFEKFLASSESEFVADTPFVTATGSRWCLVAMRKYQRSIHTYVVIVALDIEEHKRAQAELEAIQVQAQESARLAALGLMAGGIAHEINNPLQVIRSLAYVLKRNALNESKEKSTADALQLAGQLATQIDDTTNRIARIIAGLRDFARVGDGDPIEEVNFSSLLNEIVQMAKMSQAASGVSIEIDPFDEKLTFACRRTDLGQVLINLINNAIDASLMNENPTERWVRLHVSDKGTDIEIRVMDSGPGIPENLLDKIMLPFFTTKFSKGVGLGLSISSSIIKQNHGSIGIDRTSPHTCFVVTLPKLQNEKQQ